MSPPHETRPTPDALRELVHELKSPLNTLALKLEALRFQVREGAGEDAEQAIDSLQRDVVRVGRALDAFVDSIRPEDL